MLARRIYHDPWDAMREFSTRLNRMLGTHSEGETDTAANWVPPIDIHEAVDAYEVSADLPGVDPKDIEVYLEGGVSCLPKLDPAFRSCVKPPEYVLGFERDLGR